MDLSRLSNLTPSENAEIATAMHALILNGIFAERSWRSPEAVFHGGTALSFAHKSGRFSEDLDFMLGSEAFKTIEKNMKRVARELDIAMNALYSGGKIAIVGPKGSEVQAWRFEWQHPNRRGKVRVKTEFLHTRKDVLKHYKTFQIVPMGLWHAAVNVSSTIPVPDIISFWADKIVAVGHRRDFKWRDAYDLAFINMTMRTLKIEDEDRYAALLATIGIYKDVTLDSVVEGLDRDFVSKSLNSPEDFSADMQNWLAPAQWQQFQDSGIFEQHLALAKLEVERAKQIIADHRPSEPKP